MLEKVKEGAFIIYEIVAEALSAQIIGHTRFHP